MTGCCWRSIPACRETIMRAKYSTESELTQMIAAVGDKINMLTVIEEVERPKGIKDLHRFYLCQCDCGKRVVVSGGNLGRGQKSCGCGRKTGVFSPKKHGFASHKVYDKLYHTWNAMKGRCYNSNSKDFPHYGARGIRICNEWLSDFMSFRAWSLSHGFANNLTIDRIDVDGDYSPENCRWITVAEQNRNKTTTKGAKE